MRSPILLSAAATFLAVTMGCDLPRGERGKAGPLSDPPSIESITPESGSANTIWTIRGTGLGEGATVTFDGHVATVLSALDGELRVTNAFPAVDSTEIRAVSVEMDRQLSNTHAVFAVPSGTVRDVGEQRIWRHIHSIAAMSGDVFYVLDVENGLFRFDRTTGAISRIAPPSALGLPLEELGVNGLFRAGGDTYLVTLHETPASGAITRISRVTGEGLALFGQIPGWIDVYDLERGPGGELYFSDASNLRRFTAEGAYDAGFFSAGSTNGLAFFDGSLYAADFIDEVVKIDITTGERTPFAGSLANPWLLEAGPDGLFVADATGLRRIDATGTVTPWYPLYPNAWSVRDDGAVFAVVDWSTPNDTSILEVTGADSLRVIASGLATPIAMAVAGEWMIVSDFNEVAYTPVPSDLYQGATLAFSGDEVRVLSTEAYSPAAYAPVDDSHVLYARYSRDGLHSELGFLEVGSGETRVLVDEADGLAIPRAFAYEPKSGDVLVSSYAVGDTSSSFSRVLTNGLVIDDFARMPAGTFALSAVVSGDYLWASAIDGNSGPLVRASHETGGALEVVGAEGYLLGVLYDGLCADGAGGVYAADTLSGTIWHVDAEGAFEPITVLDPDVTVVAVELDAATGDLLATVFDGSAGRVARVVP